MHRSFIDENNLVVIPEVQELKNEILLHLQQQIMSVPVLDLVRHQTVAEPLFAVPPSQLPATHLESKLLKDSLRALLAV